VHLTSHAKSSYAARGSRCSISTHPSMVSRVTFASV